MALRITRRQFVQGTASAAALSLLASCTRMVPGPVADSSTPAAANNADVPQVLLDGLADDDLVIQADAARLLGDLGSRRATAALVHYVRTDRRYAKTAGLDALARLGDPAVCADLRPLVDQPNCFDDHWWYGRMSVRVAAALALLSLGDETGVPFLTESRSDERDWALFSWYAPTVLQLPDRSAAVRRVQARVTVEALLPEGKDDPGQLVVICRALSLLGTPAARDRLVGLTTHRSRYVRARAAQGLAAMSSRPEDLVRVTTMARGDSTRFVRLKASEALVLRDAGLRYAESVARAAREARDPFDRAAALDSLGVLARDEYAPAAIAALRESDAYVRLAAAAALDRIGSTRAVDAVRTVRHDSDLRVRLQAAKCLAAHAVTEGADHE
jgi:HEAT repeat protein